MKKLLITCMLAISSLSLGLSEAQAKRMGSGTSFGKQSQQVNRAPAQRNEATDTAAAKQTPGAPGSAAAAPKPSSPWKNILGGALLGLGLGALLSHFGLGAFGDMLGTILMIGLLAFAAMFIFNMIRNKNRPARSFAQAAYAPAMNSHAQPMAYAGHQATSSPADPSSSREFITTPWGIPSDFDVTQFLRNAKTYFIRLQAAWDKADSNDIREFTAPEMFAELKMQLQERGPAPNHTDVVSLDAELMGIETIGEDHMASVKFSGLIKESQSAAPEPFTEIWNLAKPLSGNGGWVLAGIQQMA